MAYFGPKVRSPLMAAATKMRIDPKITENPLHKKTGGTANLKSKWQMNTGFGVRWA